MLIVVSSIVIIAVLVLFVANGIYGSKCKRQRKMRVEKFNSWIEYQKKICNPQISDEQIQAMKNNFDFIVERGYSTLLTFTRYQLIEKVFGATSVILSTTSFFNAQGGCDEWAIRISSIVSVLCVLVIIYINPLDRARGYLKAWRVWNGYIEDVCTELSKSVDDCEKEMAKIGDIIKEEADGLGCDDN